MSKKIFVIIAICMVFMIAVYAWLSSPNSEAKASHQSILCNVIPEFKLPQPETEIFDAMFFTFEDSLPMHAYKRPKFKERYAKSLIHHFSKLSIKQQLEAQNDYKKCMNLIR